MEWVRFEVELECDGRVQRVTLLAGSWRDVGRWVDVHFAGAAVVRIERAAVG